MAAPERRQGLDEQAKVPQDRPGANHLGLGGVPRMIRLARQHASTLRGTIRA
jgi:hypothetical protein